MFPRLSPFTFHFEPQAPSFSCLYSSPSWFTFLHFIIFLSLDPTVITPVPSILLLTCSSFLVYSTRLHRVGIFLPSLRRVLFLPLSFDPFAALDFFRNPMVIAKTPLPFLNVISPFQIILLPLKFPAWEESSTHRGLTAPPFSRPSFLLRPLLPLLHRPSPHESLTDRIAVRQQPINDQIQQS